MVEQITKRSNSKNSFNAWGEATPIHNRLIDAITRSSMHIIATMRSKTEYVVEMGSNGKTAPRKVGTAPIQRDGFEYEFDVFCDLDIENTLIVQKTRCPALSGAVVARPDAKVADILKTWLSGDPAPAKVSEAAQANGHQEQEQPALTLNDVKWRARDTGIAKTGKDWQMWVAQTLGVFVPDEKLKDEQARLVLLNDEITKKASAGAGK